MTEIETLNARIDALETRVAFQDETIEDLNQAIIAQWKQIEALNRLLAQLQDRVEIGEQRADLAGLPEPPPPHY
ncbi:SlyX family protein [Labrys sp. LIt4]|uniref:SlyX family protein n=1 Tax=Labrys sp. LIt4 TaxID=2821355 RepID=UPI001ADF6BB6|nr:SlyX family protein [Labrys sp. LIt4]MBP0579384.1 SlyX family protein [Labrys sp. LIt4]